MRDYFNSEVLHRVESGELTQEVKFEGHPSPAGSGEPFCTRSQIVRLWDGDEKVAVVHRYLRSDGTLGGSGRPDPKWLKVGSEVWSVVPD